MAIFIVMALSWHCVTARADANNSHNVFHYADSEVFADSLTVSVVTCYPGPEIYELCGHSAVRVKGRGETLCGISECLISGNRTLCIVS